MTTNQKEKQMENIERRIRNLEMAMFGKSGNFWHSRDVLEDDTPVGKIGAMTHIVDECGYPLSKGYREIEVVFPKSCYIGLVGAREERFEVDCY
jgi:hypothetical protein